MMVPKPPKRVSDPVWLGRVAELPCVCCEADRTGQLRPPPARGWPIKVHHCIHGRHSQRRADDRDTIPLCEEHHDEQSPVGIHRSKEAWERRFGPDTAYIERVRLWLGMP